MVIVPAGTFMIGSPENERGRNFVRGGCFADPQQMTFSSFRNWGNNSGVVDPDLSRGAGCGFRVGRTL